MTERDLGLSETLSLMKETLRRRGVFKDVSGTSIDPDLESNRKLRRSIFPLRDRDVLKSYEPELDEEALNMIYEEFPDPSSVARSEFFITLDEKIKLETMAQTIRGWVLENGQDMSNVFQKEDENIIGYQSEEGEAEEESLFILAEPAEKRNPLWFLSTTTSLEGAIVDFSINFDETYELTIDFTHKIDSQETGGYPIKYSSHNPLGQMSRGDFVVALGVLDKLSKKLPNLQSPN